jgi:hypothetical protein
MTLLNKVTQVVRKTLKKLISRSAKHRPDCEKIEIIMTDKCNLHCFNCDMSCTQAISETHMSLDQIAKFVDESIALNWKWQRMRLLGGEPTLHPEFFKIIAELKKYKEIYPLCKIELVTNGFGDEVNRVLAELPSWVCVENSNKKSKAQTFCSFNLAPIDLDEYKNKDFSIGCSVLENCGIALSQSGFYPCSCASGIDRIFGFDIGIKELRRVSSRKLGRYLRTFCRYCGHYKRNYDAAKIDYPAMSDSWKKAYADYHKKNRYWDRIDHT